MNSGPVRSRVLIHGGLRSMGVWLLRASRRSSLRPSGASTTAPGYVPACAVSRQASAAAEKDGHMILSTVNGLPGYEITEVGGEV